MTRRSSPDNPQSAIPEPVPLAGTGGPKLACPAGGMLEAFARGDLGDAETEAVAAHLDDCTSCRERVESVPSEAAINDELHQAGTLQEQTPLEISVPLQRLNELLSDYEVVREIGRGGMGIVYEARQVKLNRTVALKVLPALLGAVRPDAIARFRREAELAAGLKHTNIISVHDFGDVDGTLYYTMELIEGRSLRDVLQEISETGGIDVVVGEASQRSEVGSGSERTVPRSSSLPLTRLGSSSAADKSYYRKVAGWFAEVAEALHYAHEHGVIHRDIKPSNLLLAADGRLMISDFGLARGASVETLTATRSLLGTARYMSPEQADEDSAPLDARTDVYALGATLYELLAFRPMFAAADDREVLNQVLNKEPTPPRRFIKQVPRELETICLKAVEKNRANRYATAKALADDLRRWLLDLPIHARRPSLPTRVGKFVRRRKAASVAVATSVVLLIITSVLYAGYRGWRETAVTAEVVVESQAVQMLFYEAEEALFRQGDHEGALEKIEQALALQPGSAKLQRARGVAFEHLDRLDAAAECFEGVLSRNADDWEAHYSLALVYDRKGNTDAAALHRAAVERLQPDTASAYYMQANAEDDPAKALVLLNQALELKPDRTEFLMGRSWQYHLLGDYEAMLADVTRVTGMHPNWAVIHEHHGMALFRLGRHAEAEQAYGRALRLAPDRALPWCNRGAARLVMGRVAEGLADVQEALRLDPDFAQAYYVRAKGRRRLGEPEKALADLKRAIALDPTDVEFHAERGGLLAEAERWPDCIDAFTHAIQVAPQDVRGYKNRGVAYLESKEYDRAIADFTKSIEFEPNNERFHRSRGYAYMFSKRYEQAIGEFARAMALQPDFPEDYHNRALCLLRLGRHEEAAADLAGLLGLRSNPSDRLRRGRAYELAGDAAKAAADSAAVAAMEGPIAEYAKLWEYVLHRDTGQREAAGTLLKAHTDARGDNIWIDRLFEMFTGEVTREELLAAAATDDERAEAHYYIGRKALLDARPDEAKDAFTKCVALDRNDVMETDFARALLEQLKDRSYK